MDIRKGFVWMMSVGNGPTFFWQGERWSRHMKEALIVDDVEITAALLRYNWPRAADLIHSTSLAVCG